MRIFRWMSGSALKDRVKMTTCISKLEVASMEDKMQENRLR